MHAQKHAHITEDKCTKSERCNIRWQMWLGGIFFSIAQCGNIHKAVFVGESERQCWWSNDEWWEWNDLHITGLKEEGWISINGSILRLPVDGEMCRRNENKRKEKLSKDHLRCNYVNFLSIILNNKIIDLQCHWSHFFFFFVFVDDLNNIVVND